MTVNRFSIGQLAAQANIGVETVRFYERRGLLPEPPRTAAGYRSYRPETVRRVRFIRRAKDLGFTLREINSLLELGTSTAVCADVQDQIHSKLLDVGARIRDLKQIERKLRALELACLNTDTNGPCPSLEHIWGFDAE